VLVLTNLVIWATNLAVLVLTNLVIWATNLAVLVLTNLVVRMLAGRLDEVQPLVSTPTTSMTRFVNTGTARFVSTPTDSVRLLGFLPHMRDDRGEPPVAKLGEAGFPTVGLRGRHQE
jgi:hypothetical protein